jgi:hypothetical protein
VAIYEKITHIFESADQLCVRYRLIVEFVFSVTTKICDDQLLPLGFLLAGSFEQDKYVSGFIISKRFDYIDFLFVLK